MTTADTVLERPADAAKPAAARKTAAKKPDTAAHAAGAATETPVTPLPPENASLVLVGKTLAEYDRVEAGLADLEKKYKDVVYPVSTDTGMAEAKAARIAIREPRYAVDKAAAAAKAPLNALKKDIDTRKEAITNRLVDLETPIHEQIKAEEERVAAAKLAEKQAKEEAAARAQVAIDKIRAMAVQGATSTAHQLEQLREDLELIECSVEVFGDRAGEALQAKMQTDDTLLSLHGVAVIREAEAAQAAADRAELEAMRAQQAERERAANAEREAAQAAETARREEETRAAAQKLADERAAFAREQEEARAAQQVEADRLAAERRELEQAQQARQREREEAEAQERRTAEAARQEEERRAREDAERERLAEEARATARRQQEEQAAATERARIDEEARQRREAEEAAHAADQLRRNASGTMLEALQAVLSDEAFVDLHAAVQGMVKASVTEATGEPA